MNLPEGLRRAGIIAGILGAGFIAIRAYDVVDDVFKQAAKASEFQALMQRNEMKKVASSIAKNNESRLTIDFPEESDIQQVGVLHSEVNSVSMKNGQFVFKVDRPSASDFALGLIFYGLFIAIGFIVPWGIVRTLSWVVSGFLKTAA